MPDNNPDAPVPKAAGEIRRILLALPSDEARRDALSRADICDGCGTDRGGHFCHCRNDE